MMTWTSLAILLILSKVHGAAAREDVCSAAQCAETQGHGLMQSKMHTEKIAYIASELSHDDMKQQGPVTPVEQQAAALLAALGEWEKIASGEAAGGTSLSGNPTKEFSDALKGKAVQKVEGAVVKGSEKLFKYLFKEAAPKGFGLMVLAHFKAPYQAYSGDGQAAVGTVMAGVWAISQGVVSAALMASGLSAMMGGPIGAVVGYAFKKLPSHVIGYFDTSSVQYEIVIYNLSGRYVFIDRCNLDCPALSKCPCQGDTYAEKTFWGQTSIATMSKERWLTSMKGWMIPPVSVVKTNVDEGDVATWSLPLVAMSKTFTIGMRFIATDKEALKDWPGWTDRQGWTGPYFAASDPWWDNRDQVVHSWALGAQAPHKESYVHKAGFTGHYASIWSSKGDAAPDHGYAYDNMAHTKREGKEGGSFVGASSAYWENFETLVVTLSEE